MIIERFIEQKCIGYKNGISIIRNVVKYKDGSYGTLFSFGNPFILSEICPEIDIVEDRNGTNIRNDNANV